MAPPEEPLSYSSFLEMVKHGDVVRAILPAHPDGRIKGIKLDGSTVATYAPLSDPWLVSDLLKAHVDVIRAAPEQESLFMNLLIAWFPTLLIIAVWLLAMKKMGGGIMQMGKSKHRNPDISGPKVTFSDVAGVDEAKEEVSELVDFLKNPAYFQQLGGRIPKGVLMVGEPGTGKTLLAKAIAGEAGVPFFSASGSEFVEMFVGVGAARVRDLFKNARKAAPCLIFIDEIDAVGKNRAMSTGGGGNDEREQTLNQLLVEMDGFSPGEGVIVIAATNRPDVLDPALLRPGRFDRQVVVPRPDLKGREQILQVHAKTVPLSDQVSLRDIARGTPGFTGADLANLVNEAALVAARKKSSTVCQSDFEQAKDRILMGAERKSVVMPEKERITTAYHEAGHTIIACLIGEDPVHKVTIIPRGRALGVTMQLPEEDKYSAHKQKLLADIAILMGGRAAEEIFLHDVTTGASNDMERATRMARRMVAEWGMSENLGPLVYAADESGKFGSDVQKLVDQEIRTMVENQYTRAKDLLLANRNAVEVLTQRLLLEETLNTDQIKECMMIAVNEPHESAATQLLLQDSDAKHSITQEIAA